LSKGQRPQLSSKPQLKKLLLKLPLIHYNIIN
jgi:hypothetical protein